MTDTKRLTPKAALTTLAIALLILVGCGGPQGGAERPERWDTLFDAIPADTPFLVYNDLDETDATMLRASIERDDASGLSSQIPEPVRAEIEGFTGLDVSDPTVLDQVGIDLAGELGAFAYGSTPVVAVRLADPTAFSAFLDDVEGLNPDLVWTAHEVNGIPFRSTSPNESLRLEIGIFGNWAVMAWLVGDPSEEEVATTLAAILSGPEDGATIRQSAIVEELSARAEAGERLAQLGFVHIAALDEAIVELAHKSANAELDAMGIEEDQALYDDPTLAEACQAEADRIAATYPWAGWASFKETDNALAARGEFVLETSRAGAERLQQVFRGTVVEASETAGDAAIFAAGHLSIDAFFDTITAAPRLRDCKGLAALSGHLATAKERFGSAARQAAAMFSGDFAFALFDFEMAGMLPDVTAAVLATSAQPEALGQQLQSMLESQGARGAVDETATFTTVEYRLLHLVVRLIKPTDRLIVTVGSVPVRFSNALATATAGAPDSPFLIFQLNGEAMQPLLDAAAELVENAAGTGDAQIDAIRAAIAQYEHIELIEMFGGWEETKMVFEVRTRMNESVLAPESE